MIDGREESLSEDVALRTRTLGIADVDCTIIEESGERSVRSRSALHGDAAPALRVANRYELRHVLGSGGFGTAYQADDEALRQPVAVKLLEPKESGLARFPWREAALLRGLRLPGVVALHDEGLVHDRFFLVMELVNGQRFPGPDMERGPLPWERVADRFRSLLTILSAVHRQGVVHRDLKPSNILVLPNGQLRLLDFGVSHDRHQIDLSNDKLRMVGTPSYLAPEQWRGLTPSRQTDIWSLGVILYETLSGRRPFASRNQRELRNAVLMGKAPGLGELQPDLPPAVIRTVDRMLQSNPRHRPASVEEVARMLDGGRYRPPRRRVPLPLLGRQEIVIEALQQVHSGRAVRLAGPAGCGRSRVLGEIEIRLIDMNARVRRLVPATAAWGSLRELVEEAVDVGNPEDADEAHQLLKRFCAQEGVLLVAEPAHLDAATQALLRHVGSELRYVNAGRQRLLSEELELELNDLEMLELEALFVGPRRFERIPQRAAAELFRRTGGRPARIAMELQAWIEAGLAEWSEGGIRIEADALARLRDGLPVPAELSLRARQMPDAPDERRLLAWAFLAQPIASPAAYASFLGLPQDRVIQLLDRLDERGLIVRDTAEDGIHVPPPPILEELDAIQRDSGSHALLAAHLPRYSPKRLHHLLEAQALEEAEEVALAIARTSDDQGRVEHTRHLLVETLRALRRAQRLDGARSLLMQLTYVAVQSNELPAIETCLNECAQLSDELGGSLSGLEKLLVVLRLVHMKSDEDLVARLRALPPFGHPLLEFCRRSAITQALRYSKDLPGWAAHIRESIAWAQRLGDPDVEGSCTGWYGAILSREGRYLEAVDAHLRAADMKRRPSARLASLINASAAILKSGGPLSEARDVLTRARDTARSFEHARYEALATVRLRNVAYASAEADLRADADLVEELRRWDHGDQLAFAIGVEAAIAWRAGQRELSVPLADEAMRTWLRCGHPWPKLVNEALHLLQAETPRRPHSEVMEEALSCPVPYIGMQILGLLARAAPLSPEAEEALRRFVVAVPAVQRTHRQEVLSWAECAEMLPER